jgi:hypothetical protein
VNYKLVYYIKLKPVTKPANRLPLSKQRRGQTKQRTSSNKAALRHEGRISNTLRPVGQDEDTNQPLVRDKRHPEQHTEQNLALDQLDEGRLQLLKTEPAQTCRYPDE